VSRHPGDAERPRKPRGKKRDNLGLEPATSRASGSATTAPRPKASAGKNESTSSKMDEIWSVASSPASTIDTGSHLSRCSFIAVTA
jgi:hypothetical protein